jgi:hypothetical protein
MLYTSSYQHLINNTVYSFAVFHVRSCVSSGSGVSLVGTTALPVDNAVVET